MSRTSVGDVYAKVINDVCEQSRDDFEGGGVDLSTLDLLRTKWQEKLSSLKVTQLPWDPPPPAPAAPNSHTLPSNVRPVPPTLPSNGNIISTPPSSGSTPGPQIKQEAPPMPSAPPQGMQYQPPMQFPPGAQLDARQRAAVNLQRAYGMQAGPQIAQLQQGNMARTPMQLQQQQAMNMIKQEDSTPPLSSLPDYASPASQTALPPIKTQQTDGADEAMLDWQHEAARRRQLIAQHRDKGDRLMREQFTTTQMQMEGGGLMIPLEERPKRRNRAAVAVDCLPPPATLGQAQGDAAADSDDGIKEEDAINSDLDDPDDAAGDDENEENTDQVMLCTYDKVQRVKNKWKCTLKDGILKVDGTEYVFHKGQGEFEW